MHKLFVLLIFVQVFIGKAQDTIPLDPCPNSPNCVCTYEKKARKSKPTLPFKGNLNESRANLKNLILGMESTELTTEEPNYLHFEFHTAIWKFIDDVEFYFDDKKKEIHYRSASRIGYGDFGANKRRMKEIVQLWSAL